MNLFSAAQMKELDRIAIEERGIPSTLLMERAAEAIVKEVLALPISREKKRDEKNNDQAEDQPSAIVFCGPGNNGGDGIGAARFLLREGWKVRCVLVGSKDKMTEDSCEMERRLIEAGGVVEDFDPENRRHYTGDVAVDALFGVGLHSELRPNAVSAVQAMKQAQWVVSADIPSGVCADTGEVLGCAVKADVTVTFSNGKPGLFVGAGAIYSGRVVVADIGVPEELALDVTCREVFMDRPKLQKRRRDAHKGDFGRLFILAGSVGYTGAPVLAARAAVRSGAGLVTLAVPREIYSIVASKCDEAMVWPWPDTYEGILDKAAGCDVVLIGPGLGQSERTEEIVLSLLHDLTCPVILDADGLNVLSRHINMLDKREGLTILTPHDGEFARLSGCELPIRDRLSAARNFALKHNCMTVLKGYRTITAAQSGYCVVNSTGNPGMAKGGSGDALAGLMAGLAVQSKGKCPEIADSVADAVWFHGRAGDLAAAEKGEYGMTIGDLIEQIPYALKECEEE